MHLSSNVRRLRRELDLTQTELAKRIGLHQPTISLIEHGVQPRPAVLKRLAESLGVTLDDLLRPEARAASSGEGSAASHASPFTEPNT